MMGDVIDLVTDDDRAFFEDNSTRLFRCRCTVPGEVPAEVEHLLATDKAKQITLVFCPWIGFRMRTFPHMVKPREKYLGLDDTALVEIAREGIECTRESAPPLADLWETLLNATLTNGGRLNESQFKKLYMRWGQG
jgi:hypothetical protein